MMRTAADLLKSVHEEVPSLVKFVGSICYTTLAAITGAQEDIAWGAQVFMWLTAGVLSVVTTVSVIIKTIRAHRKR